MIGKKAAFQLRIDENAHRKLKYNAEKELRSLNAQIEYFIYRGIDEYEKRNGVIPSKAGEE